MLRSLITTAAVSGLIAYGLTTWIDFWKSFSFVTGVQFVAFWILNTRFTVDRDKLYAEFEEGFEGKEIILATAHPAKFPDTIQAAIGEDSTHASLEVLKSKEIVKYSVEPTPAAIKAFMRARV